ncbi:MAG TPA: HAMP domain-containing sensor histidine kinase [Actinomycetota bacterium]|nr:HAMP domain-containing sensor histidine kinase [Actinomycetota bacterium]
MSAWRSAALATVVALAGAVGTLVAGAVAGMGGSEIASLGLLLLPAIGATAVAAGLARPLLARASLRQRLVAVAIVGVVVGLANLGVLAALMFVSRHDAVLMAALLVYSIGAGVGVALAVSRGAAAGVRRLALTAGKLAEGDLDARVGRLDSGPELEVLGRALDDMASRLQSSILAEREAEGKRRDLVSAVSHDLRTPLAGLRAMVEAIEDRVVEDPATMRRYAIEMRRQVDALVTLVDDLFELVQLDAGAITAESARARLADVVGSAVEACRAQAVAKGLSLERRLDGAGDATCSPRLVRVLQNLLQNAIRHTPADGAVRIEARRELGELEVAVEDSGPGIPPETIERVFDPFWRGDAARSTPGSGLGLALAKRIVEALGGRIQVESTLARGSRFAVVLPERK